MLFCVFINSDVYAGYSEDEIFLCVGEKYVIEQQEGALAEYTSQNEEIASIEKQIITGISPGETYIIVNTDDHAKKKIRIYVGDYKLCVGQTEEFDFDMSSVINAWDSSIRSSDTSVIWAKKLGYELDYAYFSFLRNL